MSRAFVTIEAIIAFVILTFAILTTTSSMKTLSLLNKKKRRYENLYATVLSLKDLSDTYNFKERLNLQGELNGFKFNIKAKKIDSRRNQVFDEFEKRKVDGAYEVQLFEVILNVEIQNFKREYKYYTLRQKKYGKK